MFTIDMDVVAIVTLGTFWRGVDRIVVLAEKGQCFFFRHAVGYQSGYLPDPALTDLLAKHAAGASFEALQPPSDFVHIVSIGKIIGFVKKITIDHSNSIVITSLTLPVVFIQNYTVVFPVKILR